MNAGTHADLLVVVFHKIITTGHQRLQPLFDCLLTILVNGEFYCVLISLANSARALSKGDFHGRGAGHLRKSSRLRSAMGVPSPSHLAPTTMDSSLAFLTNQERLQSQIIGLPAT